MNDPSDNDKLRSLSERLARARTPGGEKSGKKGSKGGNQLGKAYRMAIELVVAVAVGGAIGWYLDKWLETGPWLFLIFFFLGVAAGFRNVYKAAKMMSENSSPDQD